MDIITSFLQSSVEFIIPLIVLLGALIFVHELGHFLVAKYCGVRVETFSLGFGKKILKYTRGDTTYCVSLIPLGGYVKMFGDDPNAEISDEEKSYSFLHKPVGQRIAIVLAGPLMNLVFAFFLFLLIAGLGDRKPLAVIGQVAPASSAAEAGLSAGDRILAVNQTEIKTWPELESELNEIKSNRVELKVQKWQSGDIVNINAPLIEKDNPSPLSWKDKIKTISGIRAFPVSSQIGVRPDSLAAMAGLKTGDQILAIGDTEVQRWYELEKTYQNNQSKQNLNFLVKRDGKDLKIQMQPNNLSLYELGIDRPDLYINHIAEGSAAEKAGLKKGDKILSINGNKLQVWSDLTKVVENYKEEDSALQAKILRDQEEVLISLKPEVMRVDDPMTGKKESVFKIGVGPVLTMAPPKSERISPDTAMGLIKTGASETTHWTSITALGFVRLVQNEVSARSIGGPIMIGQIASESYKIGINAFLKIMAIISINLFLLNLLPIPVLDGGHLLFFTIEAIKGSPLSMSKLEKAQQIGLFVLLFLMVFAIFNDISRVFGISW